MWLYPVAIEEHVTEVVSQFVVDKTADKPIRSALVEADDTPLTWQPEQHGNVVIAEPDIMAAHRRGEL